jgi:hypothetical protein
MVEKTININDDKIDNIKVLSLYSSLLTELGFVEKTLEICNILKNENKDLLLYETASFLLKKEDYINTNKFVEMISDYKKKNYILTDLTINHALNSNFSLAEKTGLEISQIDTRQECWKTIAKNAKEQLSWKKELEQVNNLQNEDARKYE